MLLSGAQERRCCSIAAMVIVAFPIEHKLDETAFLLKVSVVEGSKEVEEVAQLVGIG